MKTSTILVTAALGPVGIMCIIASGFLESCSQIGFTNLEGDAGRSIMLQAYCKVQDADDHWTELDLNTCFGWSADTCNFIPPASGHFTDSCTSCYISTGGFDGTFSCRGPCNDGSEVFRMFNLDDYVGNLIGTLVC